MKVIQARNVCEAYRWGVYHLQTDGYRRESRAGDVIVYPEPVTTVYAEPQERVLFDERRDANPFFHLHEALWMLAGRDDATWLDQFVSDFSSRFAEEFGRQHGAYGYRWRKNWDLDQLDAVVNRLRRYPDDRRAVIAMWDPDHDLFDPAELNEDTGEPWPEPKDIPCNTHVYPRIRDGRLDLTVCCRSNDAIWGAHGANAVHFSILLEYLAARVGVGIGKMWQISNDYHAYVDVLERVTPLEKLPTQRYEHMTPRLIVSHPETFDAEVAAYVEMPEMRGKYRNSFLSEVARPMWHANKARCQGDLKGAMSAAFTMRADDWKAATLQWLKRRVDKQRESAA